MPEQLDDLLDALESDPWREAQRFSPDIENAHTVLFAPVKSRAEQAEALAEWLKQSQPCLFGRMAAKSQIAYCILKEADLFKGEAHVRDFIHQSRRVWRRNGFRGKQHGFVI